MKANYDTKPKATSEVSLGNLYDMNKQLMEHEMPMDGDAIEVALNELQNWLAAHWNDKYFMLLCHECRDYTLFNLDKTSTWARPQGTVLLDAAKDVLECMTNRGTLLAVSLQPDGVYELWIRNDEGCFAYYLFPYGTAVLEY